MAVSARFAYRTVVRSVVDAVLDIHCSTSTGRNVAWLSQKCGAPIACVTCANDDEDKARGVGATKAVERSRLSYKGCDLSHLATFPVPSGCFRIFPVVRCVDLHLSDGLLARVDAARGLVPRNVWLREVVVRAVVDQPVVVVERSPKSPAEASSVPRGRTVIGGMVSPSPRELQAEIDRIEAVGPKLRGLVAHRPSCRCPVCRPPKRGVDGRS